jgi:hypothetical protein
MNKDLKQALKIFTGIIIVPFGIMASKLWPWWQKQSLPLQIVSGFLVLPFMLIAAPMSNWWDNF